MEQGDRLSWRWGTLEQPACARRRTTKIALTMFAPCGLMRWLGRSWPATMRRWRPGNGHQRNQPSQHSAQTQCHVRRGHAAHAEMLHDEPEGQRQHRIAGRSAHGRCALLAAPRRRPQLPAPGQSPGRAVRHRQAQQVQWRRGPAARRRRPPAAARTPTDSVRADQCAIHSRKHQRRDEHRRPSAAAPWPAAQRPARGTRPPSAASAAIIGSIASPASSVGHCRGSRHAPAGQAGSEQSNRPARQPGCACGPARSALLQQHEQGAVATTTRRQASAPAPAGRRGRPAPGRRTARPGWRRRSAAPGARHWPGAGCAPRRRPAPSAPPSQRGPAAAPAGRRRARPATARRSVHRRASAQGQRARPGAQAAARGHGRGEAQRQQPQRDQREAAS